MACFSHYYADFLHFFLDFPQIVNLKVSESNVNITWLPAFKGECHVFGYLIYYRKVIREVNTSKWNVVSLSQYKATNYNLQLHCYREYEITVTAQSANGETPVNQSKLWKVKTGGGKYSHNHKNYNFFDGEENVNERMLAIHSVELAIFPYRSQGSPF